MKVILESEHDNYICPMPGTGRIDCVGKKCMWWEEISSFDGKDGFGYCGVKGPIEGFDE